MVLPWLQGDRPEGEEGQGGRPRRPYYRNYYPRGGAAGFRGGYRGPPGQMVPSGTRLLGLHICTHTCAATSRTYKQEMYHQ